MGKLHAFLTAAAALLIAPLSLDAQPYSTSWPYLYSDFKEGTIYMQGGQKMECRLNIHLLEGRLHYLDKDSVVREPMPDVILYFETGDEKFTTIGKEAMRVEAECPDGYVACLITGDFDALMVGTGAYGSPAHTMSIRQYTSIDLKPGANTSYTQLIKDRHNGKEVNLLKEYYIVMGDQVYPALRGDIERDLPKERRKEFRNFIKDHKIKWNDPQKLILLVEFLTAE